MTARRALRFNSSDEVIADIERLRSVPLVRAGNWSLEQACWHLNVALNYFMSPGPHPMPNAPPEARENLKRILAGGQIPNGIRSPDQAVPPDVCSADSVDRFIQTLRRLKTFEGPFAPHRLFGPLTLDEGRRLALIHSAHHLSYLIPVSEPSPTA
jgi:hypothetical protein